MDQRTPLVAIVDDDPSVCRGLSRLVGSLGCPTVVFQSGEGLRAGCASMRPDHVLVDLHMPGLRGPALISALKDRNPSLRITVMTGLDQPGAREACLGAGAVGYVLKPLSARDLSRILGLASA
ncbi:response regulator [Paracoccus sp. Z330]|uniref:Response regulator n=1 Tax=Paracoccus onchidii TaxID=3017813 RepID=A0ABT4ZKC3_9RHOB|nr:response regulator [Paracoccus onchidii]MDB6179659.1 response regulator [Paracoccus onchidii]